MSYKTSPIDTPNFSWVMDGAGTIIGVLSNIGNYTQFGASSSNVKKTALTANSTVLIPANQYLQAIAIAETSGNASGAVLNIGTTDGANDILAIPIQANLLNIIDLSQLIKAAFSLSASTTIYINCSNWGSAVVNITFIMGTF